VDGSSNISPNVIALILWILGGLFLFVSLLFGVMVKMGLLMFGWRREIDKDHSENAIEIGKIEALRRDVERLYALLDDLQKRVAHGRERRLLDRRKIDDMGEDG